MGERSGAPGVRGQERPKATPHMIANHAPLTTRHAAKRSHFGKPGKMYEDGSKNVQTMRKNQNQEVAREVQSWGHTNVVQ